MNICVIPARGGSKGIPKKNIKEIAGKPMLAWSVQQALKCEALDGHVYVSSDSDEILAVAEEYGARGVKRPDEFANDTATSESAVRHTVESVEAQTGKSVENVVFLQATSPVRAWDDISRAFETFKSEGADSLLSVQPLRDYFLWQEDEKVEGSHKSINFDYKNRKRRQDIEKTYLENGSIYIFKREILFEENNRLGRKISLHEMDKLHSQQIDDPEDLEFCDYLLRKYYV